MATAMDLRELDARVHEQLFGQTVVDQAWPCFQDYETGEWVPAYSVPRRRNGQWGTEYALRQPVFAGSPEGWPPTPNEAQPGWFIAYVRVVPFYSDPEDWNGMRLVVERMWALGWWMVLNAQAPGRMEAIFGKSLWSPEHRAEASAAPEAVCHAALAALEARP